MFVFQNMNRVPQVVGPQTIDDAMETQTNKVREVRESGVMSDKKQRCKSTLRSDNYIDEDSENEAERWQKMKTKNEFQMRYDLVMTFTVELSAMRKLWDEQIHYIKIKFNIDIWYNRNFWKPAYHSSWIGLFFFLWMQLQYETLKFLYIIIYC